mmetsp:Transcript_2284/g.5853  ORF Transcript_2284/g.5853 Transcript_2284/m.5853 type:complete len:241 (-) Transcript_2284:3835-4557(-)
MMPFSQGTALWRHSRHSRGDARSKACREGALISCGCGRTQSRGAEAAALRCPCCPAAAIHDRAPDARLWLAAHSSAPGTECPSAVLAHASGWRSLGPHHSHLPYQGPRTWWRRGPQGGWRWTPGPRGHPRAMPRATARCACCTTSGRQHPPAAAAWAFAAPPAAQLGCSVCSSPEAQRSGRSGSAQPVAHQGSDRPGTRPQHTSLQGAALQCARLAAARVPGADSRVAPRPSWLAAARRW